jgi:hypothetical protein
MYINTYRASESRRPACTGRSQPNATSFASTPAIFSRRRSINGSKRASNASTPTARALPNEPTHFMLIAPERGHLRRRFHAGRGRGWAELSRWSFRCASKHASLVEALPLLPSIFGPFYEAATTVAEAARGLTAQDLAAQVDWLKETLKQSAPALPLNELLAGSSFFELRVAIGSLNEGGGYALHTLATACEQASAKPPESAKQTVTLECPTPTDGMRAFWLELIRRKLRRARHAVGDVDAIAPAGGAGTGAGADAGLSGQSRAQEPALLALNDEQRGGQREGRAGAVAGAVAAADGSGSEYPRWPTCWRRSV